MTDRELLEAALEQQEQEPVAWGQLGLLNGKTYLRMNYDRTPYPPPAGVVRNLNLVPLYAAPLSALEQPEPDYYLLPTNKKEPRPGLVNLEEFPGFLYESPNGWHIGDMKVVKWLLNNREADYWAQFKEKS